MKKIIRIECVKLDPFIVLADSAEEAHLMFIGQMMEAFDHVPMGTFTVVEWDTGDKEKLAPLRNFARQDRRGFAYPDDDESGWWMKPLP